jgi:Cu/Ag efflux pump CusA
MSSLMVALLLTPALSLILLPGASERKESGSMVKLKNWYEKILPRILKYPKRVFVGMGLLLLVTLASIPFLGEEFLPNFKEYDFLMHWVEKPGTSIEAMDRITIRVSKELRAIPGVRNFGSHIGRAEVADEVVGPNFTELWISLDPEVNYTETVNKIQDVVNGYPGLYRDLLTYLRERIKEVLTGSSATLVIRIYGENLEVIRAKAEEVRGAIADVKGVIDLKVQPQELVPQIEIRVRPDRAAVYGLTAGMIRESVNIYQKGVKVGEFFENQSIFDVVVWGSEDVRSNLAALQSLKIDISGGGIIPLREVAEVVVAPVPNIITREFASRYTEVTCNVDGRDLGRVARDIEDRMDGLTFDRGYHHELLGEYTAQKESKNRILAMSILALLGIFIILQADFGSSRLALVVFTGLPFALTGGIITAFISGGILSLGSLIGFITVLGIAARNSIMLISHYRHLELNEGMEFGLPLIVRGAKERLMPILLTAMTTALALMAIIVGGNRPGQEIEFPMALVILGGLITSALMNLLIMPLFYYKFGKEKK